MEKKQTSEALKQIANNVYNILTKKNYLTNPQIMMLVNETTKKVTSLKTNTLERVMSIIIIIRKVQALGRKFQTLVPFERRFHNYFNALVNECVAMLPELKKTERMERLQPIVNVLQQAYFEDVSANTSPWETLLFHWFLLEKDSAEIQRSLTLFLTEASKTDHVSVIRLTSFLALLCGQGSVAITYFKKIKSRRPQDLYYHFLFFKQKNDWDGIIAWLEMFFAAKKKESLGVLLPFYEEAIANQQHNWDDWLQKPTFQTYASKQKNVTQEERRKNLQFLLPKLKERAYHDTVQRVFLQIVIHEQLLEEGITFLLKYEHQPSQLSNEKKRLLQLVEEQKQELLLPLYHQFVIRLIEKKTRQHYEEAVNYMEKLKQIYDGLQKEATFRDYEKKLKTYYKTYRALLQEMKRLDVFVQSK